MVDNFAACADDAPFGWFADVLCAILEWLLGAVVYVPL